VIDRRKGGEKKKKSNMCGNSPPTHRWSLLEHEEHGRGITVLCECRYRVLRMIVFSYDGGEILVRHIRCLHGPTIWGARRIPVYDTVLPANI